MLRKGLIHLFFVAPLLLLGISVPGIPSDAGLSYRSTLYAGLRDLSVQQELFFADSLRYAVSVDELREVGWRAPAPRREGVGEFHFVTAAADTTGYAIEGRYSGMPDVLCYAARGAVVPDLPAPTWWDGVEDRPDCTPGAPQQVPGGLVGSWAMGPVGVVGCTSGGLRQLWACADATHHGALLEKRRHQAGRGPIRGAARAVSGMVGPLGGRLRPVRSVGTLVDTGPIAAVAPGQLPRLVRRTH